MHAAPDEEPPECHVARFRLTVTRPDGIIVWATDEWAWTEKPDPAEGMRVMMRLYTWAGQQLVEWA